MKKIILVGLACMLTAMMSVASGTVTLESLLNEMVGRDNVARYPKHDFRLKQHSSYNRASKTPDEPRGWFANGDFNKPDRLDRLIRIEEKDGKKEYVLMDHKGAGVLVRTWMPSRGTNQKALLRFYFDGSDTPALEGKVIELLDGNGLIQYPFAHPSLLSAVSFFPIPYAKSCKITMTEPPFFFQFTFREYEEGTEVKTFTMEDYKAAKSTMERVGKSLLKPQAGATDDTVEFTATLQKGKEESVKLPKGEAAVRELSVKLGDYSDPDVTRQVVLKMEFDGNDTVWCPIGDFFGSGVGLNPVQGWYRTVAEDGKMSCRWVMPYKKNGKISVVNFSDEPVDVELKAKTGAWEWDDRSMYFNAMWRGQYPVPTRPMSDWNYVTLKGRGVFVGDTLTIMNPVESWWGEGDERIWVDGEDFPSIFGTGTEDYYAYSWGGCSTDFYEHPFHAQVFCHKYNKLNRKPQAIMNVRNTQGFSTETRSRALDTMPFGSSLQLDMEIWSGADCDMGYQAGSYWYGFADTTSNRKPEPEEVLNVPPLPEMSAVASSAKEKPAAAKPAAAPAKSKAAFENSVEVENTKITSSPKNMKQVNQNLRAYKGDWSKQSHVLFRAGKVGDFVEFSVPASGKSAQKLVLHATKSHDFGIVKVSVNGRPAGADVDLYSPKPVPSGAIELGSFEPVDKAYAVRVEVVGKNKKSSGTLFGIDCVTFE